MYCVLTQEGEITVEYGIIDLSGSGCAFRIEQQVLD